MVGKQKGPENCEVKKMRQNVCLVCGKTDVIPSNWGSFGLPSIGVFVVCEGYNKVGSKNLYPQPIILSIVKKGNIESWTGFE